MNTRKDLHELLVEALGSNQVYFQSPSGKRMTYPAIVYDKTTMTSTYANNKPYHTNTYFNVVVISPDPDEPAVNRVSQLPTAKPGHRYVADNLYHDPFTFYI